MDWTNYDSRRFAWLGERAHDVYTQSGEDGLLEAIFEKIGVTNKCCFECGAADGLFFSNTRRLIDQDWQAVLVEADDESFGRLLKLCDPDGVAVRTELADGAGSRFTTPQFALWHCMATYRGERSLDAILEASYAPKDLDLLVIDIDGQDYYLFNSLAKYRPRVIVCEYDANVPSMQIPKLNGPGMSGDMAIVNVANARGYLPVCKTPYNLIFVRRDLIDLVAAPADDATVIAFYEQWEKQTNAFLSDVKGVVHIGANSGQERDLYGSRNLSVIWVEALPDVFSALGENILPYPNQRALCYLLTEEDGKEYDFGVANNDGQSSSIFDFADHKKIWPHVHYKESITLQSVRFDTMIQRHAIDLAGYDALVMDTQGSELLVLKGMGDLVSNFRYIRSETADFEIYKGCCQLKDLDEYLIPRGFKRAQTWRAAGRPGVGYAYEVLYVRNDVQAPEFREDTGLALINDFAQPKDDLIRLCAVMSTGRTGFLSTMDCVFSVMAQLQSNGFVRSEGVYWGQTLTRAIEDALAKGANYILTIDFDSLFSVDDVKRLVCHLYDNPEVDIVVAVQIRREDGGLLFASDGEVDLRQGLIPIFQGHFGLTMIRASAFEKLSKPWFLEVPDEKGGWGEGRIDSDIYFWKNCREHNLQVRGALDVVIGHLELVASWPDQRFQTVYQTLTDWRKIGKPKEAFIKPPAEAVATR